VHTAPSWCLQVTRNRACQIESGPRIEPSSRKDQEANGWLPPRARPELRSWRFCVNLDLAVETGIEALQLPYMRGFESGGSNFSSMRGYRSVSRADPPETSIGSGKARSKLAHGLHIDAGKST
jgi:hypothetical protein